jgi:predicted O-linked N-acetylglucosamine transferase (SPINDLY family)
MSPSSEPNPSVLLELALERQRAGSPAAGQQALRAAIAVSPDQSDAMQLMGVFSPDRRTAATFLQRSIAADSGSSGAHNNLGSLWRQDRRPVEARASLRRAVTLDPSFAEAWNNLGIVYRQLDSTPAAISCFRYAVAVLPSNVDAINNLGNSWRQLAKPALAFRHYRRALCLEPQDSRIHGNYADAMWETGDDVLARLALVRSLAIRLSAGVRFRLAIWRAGSCMPDDADAILGNRRALLSDLKRLSDEAISIDDPLSKVGATNFYLAYHGLNNRPINEAIAATYRRLCPDLRLRPSPLRPKDGRRVRRRLAFLSAFLQDTHPVGQLFNPIVQAFLDASDFEVVVFAPERHLVSEAISRHTRRVIRLPKDMELAKSLVAAEGVDILVYPDIGMTPLSYYLAFHRMAPVQVALWGHVDTTGLDTVDWFVSSSIFEPADCDRHYTEKVARFSSLGFCLPRIAVPDAPRSRDALGFPHDRRVYFCPMRLQKIHPEMDRVIAEILALDPSGVVVLPADKISSHWETHVLRRLRRAAGLNGDRIATQPWADQDTFLHRLIAADVILDSPHNGGITTSNMCLSVGAPMVTWPSPLARGRVMSGLYRAMDLTDCIVDRLSNYAQRAVDIARDVERRRTIGTRSKQRRQSELFEPDGVIREYRAFFRRISEG